MTHAVEKRSVQRDVNVYRCDKCGGEAIDDQLAGWVCAGLLEAVQRSDFLGSTRTHLQVMPGNEKHLCPTCWKALEEFINFLPAPPKMPVHSNDCPATFPFPGKCAAGCPAYVAPVEQKAATS